jgi:hypothetical protein
VTAGAPRPWRSRRDGEALVSRADGRARGALALLAGAALLLALVTALAGRG